MSQASTQPQSTDNPVDRIAQLEETYRETPDKAFRDLSKAYLLEGRPKEAVRVLERHDPEKDQEALVLLAQAYFDDFNNAKASELIKLADSKADLSGDLRAQLLLGELAFESGEGEKAKQHLHAVRKLDAKHVRAAQLLQNLGEDVPIPQESTETETDDGIGFRTDDPERETAKSAGLQITIGALLVVALFGGYLWTANRSHQAKELAREGLMMLEASDVGSLRRASETFREALDVQSGNPFAMAGLAEAQALLWVDHGIQESKSEAVKITRETVSDDIEKAERYSAQLLVAYGNADYAGAENVARKILERGANSEKIFFPLGMTLRAQGKVNAGLENLKRAAEIASNNPAYASTLGDAYDDAGQMRNARNYWDKAANANTNYVQGAARALWARVRRNEPIDMLAKDFERLKKSDPENVGPYGQAAIELVGAEIAYRTGDYKAAMAGVAKATELRGETPRLIATKGRYLLGAGKTDEGLAVLKQAQEMNPKLDGYFFGLARAYVDAGKAKEALALLATREKEFESLDKFLILRADAFLAAGNGKKAKAIYDQMLKDTKDDPDAFLGLGKVAAAQGKIEEATQWFEKAIAKRTTFPEVLESVGLMFASMDAPADGNTQLEEANRIYIKRGADKSTLRFFYQRVIDVMQKARGGSSYASAWGKKLEELGKES